MDNIQPNLNDHCIDCLVDTIIIGEYYMVLHSVWAQTSLGPKDGMLCITCLERRIGRQLTNQDFLDLPINKDLIFRSQLLLSRISQ